MLHPVTLTTDFGSGSCYVAAMKGVLYSINPQIQLVDLTHQVPPQNLLYTSYFLQAALPYYPPDTLHVVVVDPGVGSERPILYVELEQQRLVVPDNGCWTGLIGENSPRRVIHVTEKKYWRAHISYTFHGRDIFAPVAAHLSLGVDPALLGKETDQWMCLEHPQPVLTETELRGEVVFIDDFGNLLTNIPGDAYRKWQNDSVHVRIGGREIAQRVQTYSEAAPGTPVVLVSSMDTVEIAVNQGNAGRQLGVDVGTPVHIKIGNG